MNTLETSFAGLKLKNPFIVSSSGLTSTPDKNKRWEEAGAAAVVLKSLFQEEIEAETGLMEQGAHTEETDYLLFYHRAHRLEEYLRLIRESKKMCTIPVIASINCYSDTEWTQFAREIEEAGADALELNIMSICSELDYVHGTYEQQHIHLLEKVRKAVNFPVIVKLGSRFTNCVPLINQLCANGASAVVLFNRMIIPDINIERMVYTAGEAWRKLSLSETLRWVGLVSARVPHMDLAASGGVSNGAGIVKALLAGASAVEVCSALYHDGEGLVQSMLQFLENWMQKNNYERISQFKGIMNATHESASSLLERTQFFQSFTLRGG